MNKINGKEKKVNQSTQTKNKKNITLKYKTKNIKKKICGKEREVNQSTNKQTKTKNKKNIT